MNIQLIEKLLNGEKTKVPEKYIKSLVIEYKKLQEENAKLYEQLNSANKKSQKEILSAAAAGFRYGLTLPVPPKPKITGNVDLYRKNIEDAAKGFAYQYLESQRKGIK